ncbi:hypothetical protein HPB51_011683 [Rhipicephalus microplus]|uniref:Uncharacterized protein n=1 Tax=Rhipicephalus microplus TaxID=6941 RepID=A0A9J6DMV1_RHIMP|nr:hypothetical protein HPB51_011683 [Rhipicephalus microplus]
MATTPADCAARSTRFLVRNAARSAEYCRKWRASLLGALGIRARLSSAAATFREAHVGHGVRLSAVAGRGAVQSWSFTLPRYNECVKGKGGGAAVSAAISCTETRERRRALISCHVISSRPLRPPFRSSTVPLYDRARGGTSAVAANVAGARPSIADEVTADGLRRRLPLIVRRGVGIRVEPSAIS